MRTEHVSFHALIFLKIRILQGALFYDAIFIPSLVLLNFFEKTEIHPRMKHE